MDAADGESVKQLKQLGVDLVAEQKENIDKMLHEIVDEKFNLNWLIYLA